MAGADGDAEAVEQGAHVKVVDEASTAPLLGKVNQETDDSIVTGDVLGTEDVHAFYLTHAPESIGGEVALVGHDGIEADGTDIIECLCKSCGCHVVRRAGLELVGQVVESGAPEADRLYHLAATHVWRDAVEPALLAVEHADARGTVYLMPAEGEEVAVEFLHVDGNMGRALGTVDKDGHAVLVGNADDVADRIHGPQHVADVRHADDAGALVEELFVFLHAELPVVGDGNDAQADALTGLQELPRDDVAVVLHLGEDDLVALLHESLSEAGGHEVDALRGAAGEDNLRCAAGIQEAAHRLARSLVKLCGLLRKEVHAAMHVGIHVIVFLRHRLHDLTRLLRRRRIVEIDERVLPIKNLTKDGEVVPY